MDGAAAILVGAGISAGHPANLPLGDTFHDLLLSGCFEAAGTVAPGLPTVDGLALLRTVGRRNVLGCIEDCLEDGTVMDVLATMRVPVAAEEHLLCALLAARGTPVLTLNFDDGIETAYSLLRRDSELPSQASEEYRIALRRWRECMPLAAPLRVACTSEELASYRDHEMPLLIKLRGSVGVGTDENVVPHRPAVEDLEASRMDAEHLAPVREAAQADRLVVIGHSGHDLDLLESLLPLLRPGRFRWVSTSLSPQVLARLNAIDPQASHVGTASEELRAMVGDAPEWPADPLPGEGFAARFERWWGGVPPLAAAQAYGWLLSQAGRPAEAIAILHSVCRARDTPRARLRLADALARAGDVFSLGEALTMFRRVALAPRTSRSARAFALIRWAECTGSLPPAIAIGTAGLAFAAAAPGGARLVIRARTAVGRILITRVRHTMSPREPGAAREAVPPWRAALRHAVTPRQPDGRDRAASPREPGGGRIRPALARLGLAVLRSAWVRAERLGSANRHSALELLLLEAELHLACLRGRDVEAGWMSRLAAVERAFAHRGDPVGIDEVSRLRGQATRTGPISTIVVKGVVPPSPIGQAVFAPPVAEGHRSPVPMQQ